jgi:hypothetical protein
MMMDPYVKNPQASLVPGPFAEGDRVRLRWGVSPVEGVIVEDRGNLGIGGRRLYRILLKLDEFTEAFEATYSAEELTLVNAKK